MPVNELMSTDVASLERAIVAAVAPPHVHEVAGWVAAFDDGTVSRAKSAAPLSHDDLQPSAVVHLRDAYAVRGLPPMFRVPQLRALGSVEAELARLGFEGGRPTDVQVAHADIVAAQAAHADVRIEAQPDNAWASVFLGEGFDPVDGASRVRTLTRAAGSLFASIREGDRVDRGGVHRIRPRLGERPRHAHGVARIAASGWPRACSRLGAHRDRARRIRG